MFSRNEVIGILRLGRESDSEKVETTNDIIRCLHGPHREMDRATRNSVLERERSKLRHSELDRRRLNSGVDRVSLPFLSPHHLFEYEYS